MFGGENMGNTVMPLKSLKDLEAKINSKKNLGANENK